jgi:hypothetical protein
MREYRETIKDDQGVALAKGGREMTFALHKEFREQPPRPEDGEIESEAIKRGYKFNTLSRSYLAGFQSALRILGGAKSGLFRVTRSAKGILVAQPIVLGKRGRIILASRKHFRQRGSLLTSVKQLAPGHRKALAAYREFLAKTDRSDPRFANRARNLRNNIVNTSLLPEGTVRLNATALAAVRTIAIRERAGRGGYLAAQFILFKKMRTTPSRLAFYAKNNVMTGSVILASDGEGNVGSVTVRGYAPGTGRIAERNGIIDRAAERASIVWRADMLKKREERAKRFAEASMRRLVA